MQTHRERGLTLSGAFPGAPSVALRPVQRASRLFADPPHRLHTLSCPDGWKGDL